MTLQASGPIKLSEVAIEFNAPFKVPMSELVRGGDYVPDAGGVGFANVNIPTAPPVALTDFYEGSGNPNPVEVSDVILPGDTGGAVMVSANELVGLGPAVYDGFTIPVPTDARFCIEARFKCGPTFRPHRSDSIIAGSAVYNDADLVADVKIGLTIAPPTASFSNKLSGFFGARIRFWKGSNPTYGVAQVQFPGLSSQWLEGPWFDDTRPSTSQYAHIRLSRGADWAGSGTRVAVWKVEIFDNEFSGAAWDEVETPSSGSFPFNAAGNMVFMNNVPEDDGEVDITVDYVRGYAGGASPPW